MFNNSWKPSTTPEIASASFLHPQLNNTPFLREMGRAESCIMGITSSQIKDRGRVWKAEVNKNPVESREERWTQRVILHKLP